MTDDLIKRLREAGSTGLDMSPGDPLCAEAADALEAMQSQLEAAELDAGRYRKVRAIHLQTAPDAWIRTGDDLDEAADAISDAVLAQEQKRE